MPFSPLTDLKASLKEIEFRRKPRVVSLMLRRFVPSPYFRDLRPESRRKQLIFIHVPKAAGTSLCDAIGWLPGHIPISRYLDFDPDRFFGSIRAAIVRHPEERLLSAYNYLQSAIGYNNSPDVRWATENLLNYKSFPEFVQSLSNKKVRRSIMQYKHFRLQADWITIPGEGQHRLTWMGRFETLETDLVDLAELLGHRLSVPHKRKPKSVAANFLWSKEMRQIIEEIYHVDYDLLNYDRRS